MKINIFPAQEMYLSAFEYIFVKNTSISEEDITENIVVSGQAHPLFREGFYFHSQLFSDWNYNI